MIINSGFIGIIMYDIPVQNGMMRKNYVNFRNELLRKGYYQIQESIYICKFKNKSTATLHARELRNIAPLQSNVRMLTLTKTQFNQMEVIAGDKTFNEKILTTEKLILEL